MIVHGDLGSEESLESIVASLRAGLERAVEGHEVSRHALRRLLIQAGELEQAAFDAPSSLGPWGEGSRIRQAFRSATSLAARAFHHACESPAGKEDADRLVRNALERMRRALDRLSKGWELHGRVWVEAPEGFAFHALFPERYREAALRWIEEHGTSERRDVLVVGIRSIGTTLSAVVAATLRARGWRARRITVHRPNRGPSARRIQFKKKLKPARWGLIVDDGPGGSESPIPAVADALARAGVSRIHPFPPAASSLEELRLGDLSLPEALWTSIEGGRADPLVRVVACGSGAWRSLHYRSPDSWPAVCRTFERPKFLCEGRSGRRILFKFAGLATAPGSSSSVAEVQARQIARLARKGLTPAPLGTLHGFVATEWLDGRPLTAWDTLPDILRWIGGYIAAAAGPPLSATVAGAARARLETMLCTNAREALGDEAAYAAFSLLRPVPVLEKLPRCGDGHMAPHEWIEIREGQILKTDAGGHDLDPMWTGRQPILWDLAGALLEWGLEESSSSALLDGFAAAGGERCAPIALDAYRAAYAAHRMGQARVGADTEADPDERHRLERDYDRWRDTLANCLGALSSTEAGV